MRSFDRLRMKGKRFRMKVLVDEDRLEDQDAITLGRAPGSRRFVAISPGSGLGKQGSEIIGRGRGVKRACRAERARSSKSPIS